VAQGTCSGKSAKYSLTQVKKITQEIAHRLPENMEREQTQRLARPRALRSRFLTRTAPPTYSSCVTFRAEHRLRELAQHLKLSNLLCIGPTAQTRASRTRLANSTCSSVERACQVVVREL
jgi:ATP/maltotriose-dependent transcriptional regulator MalT